MEEIKELPNESIRNDKIPCQWSEQFESNNYFPIIHNINISILLSIGKLPTKHIHFCFVECSESIEINLRDKDIQAFCLLLDEFKHLFMVSFFLEQIE